jgi:trimethylamine--corrinoid protein Co-methyltransferase
VTALPAVLCGTNLIHDIGYLESGMTGSFEMIAIGNEIADICFRIARGVTVDDETLATDIVANVGPGGQFLAQKHHRLIRQLEKKLEREQISLGRDLLSTDRL